MGWQIWCVPKYVQNSGGSGGGGGSAVQADRTLHQASACSCLQVAVSTQQCAASADSASLKVHRPKPEKQDGRECAAHRKVAATRPGYKPWHQVTATGLPIGITAVMLSNMASNMAADCASRCLSCAMECQMVPACAEGAQSLCTQLTDKQLTTIFPHLTSHHASPPRKKSNAGAILGHCLQHPKQCSLEHCAQP